MRFTGHERDTYSNLDYMHARYYNFKQAPASTPATK